MTELRVTRCDVEGGCGTYWLTPASQIPMSWETVARRVVKGDGPDGSVSEVVRHLCPRHRGLRVQGQVGGQ